MCILFGIYIYQFGKGWLVRGVVLAIFLGKDVYNGYIVGELM